MTETRSTSSYPDVRSPGPEPTGWVGWILFAGMMLILVGTFQFIAGLVGIFDDGYYAVTANHLVVHMSYTAWGWTYLALGALSVLGGYGIMAGKTWARWYAMAVVFVSAVGNLASMAAYPIWGIIMITLDVLVIWALAVHYREVKPLD